MMTLNTPVSPSERVEYTGNRVKRNVSFAEQIKDLYDNTCQVCKVFLKTPIEGIGISEAAHIKAIGSPMMVLIQRQICFACVQITMLNLIDIPFISNQKL